jgi:hypothetical protein
MRRKYRQPANPEIVKTSVPLPVEIHTKLRAMASLRGVTMGELIVGAVGELVASIIVYDSASKTTRAGDSVARASKAADPAA